MRRSTDRILVSHAGTLPRPDDLTALVDAGPPAAEAFEQRLPAAIKQIVQQQADLGIDVVNDGEFSKQGGRGGFSHYIRDRITGVQEPGATDAHSRAHLSMGPGGSRRSRRRAATRRTTASVPDRSSMWASTTSSATSVI